LAGSAEACNSDADCAAGACVHAADGRTQCGPQCSASLDALRGRDAGLTMGLSGKPRGDGNHR
jgi:hypothetical protein